MSTPLAQLQITQLVVLVAIGAGVIFMLIFFAIFASYFRLCMQLITTGARIGVLDLIGMRFRNGDPTVIVRSKIMSIQAGLTDESGITSNTQKAHLVAGG